MYFSLGSLKGLIPFRHYDLWLLFVKSCYLLCRQNITNQQIENADLHIQEFCEGFVHLFGKEAFTPNLHLHGHLKECIEDFGPVYSFWLFSFEHLNGVLGSYPTSNKNISIQLMRRFSDHWLTSICNWPIEFVNEFAPLLVNADYLQGSLLTTSFECSINKNVEPIPPNYENAFTSGDLSQKKSHSQVIHIPHL